MRKYQQFFTIDLIKIFMSKYLTSYLKKEFGKTNIQQKVDQVVTIIFRANFLAQLEVLFLQRTYSPNDHYSGDVCFPGGYREKGETCISTSIRQTSEQTGLVLTSNNYIGALQFTFFTRKGKSRIRATNQITDLRMGILMFEIDYEYGNNLKLNEKQIRASKWIQIKQFLEGSGEKFTTWDIEYRLVPEKKSIVKFPAIMIGMDRQLYGLTLYSIMLFTVTISNLKRKYPDLDVKIDEEFVKKFSYHCIDLKVEGNTKQLEMARKQYLQNRVGFLKSKL